MKNVELDENAISKLVGQMFMYEDFITAHQLVALKQHIERPVFDYNSTPNSLWALYNHTTASLRSTHPFNHMDAHISAHDFFCKEANILLNNPKKITVPVDEYHISPNQMKLFKTV